MSPDGEKVRVTARVSKELVTRLHQYYTNLSPAITEALELLVATKEGVMVPTWHHWHW